CFHLLSRPLRASDNEPEGGDGGPSERLVETVDEARREQLELVRPDGRFACHRDHSGALRDGLGFARDHRARNRLPLALKPGDGRGRRRAGGHAGERLAYLTRLLVAHAAASSATAPSATNSSSTSGSRAPGTCSAS